MLTTSVGYPDLNHVSKSLMSLATPGVVNTPNFFKGPYLENQHNYFKEGFQGLGFTTVDTTGATASDYLSQLTSTTTGSMFAGSGGTLFLIGIGIGIYYLAKALGPESQKKRAKARYDEEIRQVKAKYSKYGFGAAERALPRL